MTNFATALCVTLVVVASVSGFPATTFAQQTATVEETHVPDIVGFTLGMAGREAEDQLRAFYATQSRELYLKRFKLDPAKPTYLGFAAPSSYRVHDDEDSIVLMFSGSASHNQLLYMTRDAIFPPDRRPNVGQTTAAIKAKYGEPSLAPGSTLYYFFREGRLVKANDCVAAADRAAAVRRPDQGGLFDEYLSQGTAAVAIAPSDCDTALIFSLRRGESVSGARSEQLSELSTAAIAFRNFRIARAQDAVTFGKSLEQPLTAGGSGPTPPPRL